MSRGFISKYYARKGLGEIMSRKRDNSQKESRSLGVVRLIFCLIKRCVDHKAKVLLSRALV